MQKKKGNLILILKPDEIVGLDGPGHIKLLKIKKNKIVVLVNAYDENTKIIRGLKDIEGQNSVKE